MPSILSTVLTGAKALVSGLAKACRFVADVWPRTTFPEKGMIVATGMAFLWGGLFGSALVKTALFTGAALTGSILWLLGDESRFIRFLAKNRRWVDYPLTVVGILSIAFVGVNVGFAIVFANLLVSSGLIILSYMQLEEPGEEAKAPEEAQASDSPA